MPYFILPIALLYIHAHTTKQRFSFDEFSLKFDTGLHYWNKSHIAIIIKVPKIKVFFE